MNYPFWDVGVGYGILMAIIAVVHVFVSHFAIGGGLYLVIAERSARKRNDEEQLGFVKRLSKFFALTTVVFGALTGVGIWFIIGLLNPAATEVLIHNFVWGWATEWCFFVIEILAALLYYYGWERLSAKNHMIIGWIYFGAAWISLVIINGIITFMLTPGEWIVTGNFWDGFFNPTYWSSLVLRTGICILLAGIYAMMVAATYKASAFKARTVRYNAVWAIIGLVVVVPSFMWYLGDIPDTIMLAAKESMAIPTMALSVMYWLTALLGAIVIIFGLLIPRTYHTVIGVVVLALGLTWFGSYEWFRESVRKPWVIHGYMYGNALEVAHQEIYTSDGLLASMKIRTENEGADLFRRACRSCHTMRGYNALAPIFDGTDQEFIAQMTLGIGVMKGNMPPWLGTEEEAHLLAAHICEQTDHRHISEIYGLEGVELGKKVWDVRCGSCHEVGGFNDKVESLAGLEEGDYHDYLDMAGDLGVEMPDFLGDEKEREALIQYMMTFEEGGAQ